MKSISIFVLHPAVRSVEKMIEYFHLYDLENEYHFIWDEQSPDYLIVTEHIYTDHIWANKFFKLYKRRVRITIFWAGECITPDMNMFDYAVSFDRNMKLEDRIAQVPPSRKMFRGFVTEDCPVSSMEEAKQLLRSKDKFCNFIYSNPLAHPMRDRLFYKISEYKTVQSL